jgi:hypothetical protein
VKYLLLWIVKAKKNGKCSMEEMPEKDPNHLPYRKTSSVWIKLCILTFAYLNNFLTLQISYMYRNSPDKCARIKINQPFIIVIHNCNLCLFNLKIVLMSMI